MWPYRTSFLLQSVLFFVTIALLTADEKVIHGKRLGCIERIRPIVAKLTKSQKSGNYLAFLNDLTDYDYNGTDMAGYCKRDRKTTWDMPCIEYRQYNKRVHLMAGLIFDTILLRLGHRVSQSAAGTGSEII